MMKSQLFRISLFVATCVCLQMTALPVCAQGPDRDRERPRPEPREPQPDRDGPHQADQEHRALMEIMETLEREKREVIGQIEHADNDKQRERLSQLLHEIENRQRQMRERLQQHHPHGEHHPGHPEGHHPEGHGERDGEMGRVHAMHEAAERLAQGGLEDMARELHMRAEQLEREIHGHREQGPPPEAVLMEIMENMDQLRHEVRELHEKLDMVIKKLDQRPQMMLRRPEQPGPLFQNAGPGQKKSGSSPPLRAPKRVKPQGEAELPTPPVLPQPAPPTRADEAL